MFMNNIGIIIQKLQGNGLDFNVFPNIEVLELKNKFNNATEDERDTPGKVGDKPIYVLQNTISYKIYSLIIGTRDGGRAGFYAIRIFIPVNSILQNFTTILNEVHSNYLSNPNSITNDSQIYNESIIKVKGNCKMGSTYVIIDNLINNKFIYYDSNNIAAIDSIFNSKETNYFNKLFAFQKPNNADEIKDEISIQNIVYQKYNFNEDFQEIKIKGRLDLIKKIKVNGKELDFNGNSDDLVLLIKKSDKVEYLLKENGIKKVNEFSNEITISIIRRNISDPPQHSFFKKYGTWIIFACGLILLLLMIVNPDVNNGNENEQAVTDTLTIKKTDTTKVKEPIVNESDRENQIEETRKGKKTKVENKREEKQAAEKTKGEKLKVETKREETKREEIQKKDSKSEINDDMKIKME